MADQFKAFYKEIEPAHAVDFQLEASVLDLTMQVTSGRYILESISLVQAVVLLLFNDQAQLTYSQIKQHLGKLASYLTSHLIPLCKPGPKQILQKQPQTESFKDSDTFRVLPDFTSKKRKLTFNTMQRREAKEDIDLTREKVLNERIFAIESNIVRILKESKKQSH